MKRSEDDEFNRRIGRLIRDARTDAGLHQVDLAQRLGTSQSAISEIETATCGSTVWFLRRIANALGFELRITFERRNYETT